MRLFGAGSQAAWAPHPAIAWDSDLLRFRWRFTPPGAVYGAVAAARDEMTHGVTAALAYVSSNATREHIFCVDRDTSASASADGFGPGFDPAGARNFRVDAARWFEAGIAADATNPALAFETSRRLGIQSYQLNPNDLGLQADWVDQTLRLSDWGRACQEGADLLLRLEAARRRMRQLGIHTDAVAWIDKAYRDLFQGGPAGAEFRRVRSIVTRLGITGTPADALVGDFDAFARDWAAWQGWMLQMRSPGPMELTSSAVGRLQRTAAVPVDRWDPLLVGVARSDVKTLLVLAERTPRTSVFQTQYTAAVAALALLARGSDPPLTAEAVRLLGAIADPPAQAELASLVAHAPTPAARDAAAGALRLARQLVTDRGASWQG